MVARNYERRMEPWNHDKEIGRGILFEKGLITTAKETSVYLIKVTVLITKINSLKSFNIILKTTSFLKNRLK